PRARAAPKRRARAGTPDARQARNAARGGAALRGARDRRALDRAGGRDAVRRPAAGRRGRARGDLGAAARDHGRADRRARRPGDAPGARSREARTRARPARDPDQPRHAARLRARGPYSHYAARQARRGRDASVAHDGGGGCDHDRRDTCRARPGDDEGGAVTYVPAEDRYDRTPYRRCGRWGLKLPALSLGLWWNFGGVDPLERSRAIVRRAFDLGITHFDLANNYGPPPGSAEENFGQILATDLAGRRDELVISTKAGYLMWPGPYGEWGSRKYVLASLEQSLK